ncbi:MAG TPA: SpoIIE family protein phosphatase [Candidatus Limnocylindrales bacterium]|nr:SpoIIE family protein phosphatase [Candidatus Limnocylindrales bacterium]
MTALSRPFRRLLGRRAPAPAPITGMAPAVPAVDERPGVAIDIPETDPLFAFLQSAPGPVDLARLELASPVLEDLRGAGVALVVPLVTQGELIGTLNLGPRLSEQDYSSDDRRLLGTLAAQAAPAIRVAQLVREQAAEAAERERYEQELRVAQLIQQQFLPRELPNLPEWQVAAYYGPARVVGGDFYDFIDLGDGRIGLVVGDVTDKGVPAALVMARTHSILRAEAPRLVAPGAVLARANELLVAEMPEKMFVTCLYMVLEPATGHVVYANAGHNLPYVRTAGGVVEFRATGMPLGLLPGLVYEEKEADIAPGDSVLLYSDGIIEAHDPGGDMYGFPRLKADMASELAGSDLLDELLEHLHEFTGRGWEQEDDITMVALRRSVGGGSVTADEAISEPPSTTVDVIAEFELPGAFGNERLAMERVATAVESIGLPPDRLERLKTAVSETAMNAIEYGSAGDPEVPVRIRIERQPTELVVRIADAGLGGTVPDLADAEVPDLDAKLAGLQKPRGWGLFLIQQMVDRVEVIREGERQTVVLTLELGGSGE